MGFLKNMMNSLTGNWADINLQIGEGAKGTDIPLKVFIQNKSEAINFSNVYVKIRAIEEIQANGSGTCHNCHQNVSVNLHNSYTVYENTIIITQAATLQPNQSMELEGKINIPPELFSTYYGQNVRLKYEIQAGIDMKGNNPDSGWRELRVL